MVQLFRRPKGHEFLLRFGLKTAIDFAHFGLESVWFLRELRECMNVVIVSIPHDEGRKRNMRIRNGI